MQPETFPICSQVNIAERKPVWMALSEFYLDTDLQPNDLERIARVILDSPYSFEEVKAINRYEVFPVLYVNLLSMAGEWAGFNEEWLVSTIQSRFRNRSWLRNAALTLNYRLHQWICKEYWQQLREVYNHLKSTRST